MAQQNINSATVATTITGSDSVFISKNDNALQKIDYDLLAKAIIEQYTGSTLGGSARSLKTAIDALNSNQLVTTGYNHRIDAVYGTDFINLRFIDSNNNIIQMAIYDSGKVSLQRYKQGAGWIGGVTLREADS